MLPGWPGYEGEDPSDEIHDRVLLWRRALTHRWLRLGNALAQRARSVAPIDSDWFDALAAPTAEASPASLDREVLAVLRALDVPGLDLDSPLVVVHVGSDGPLHPLPPGVRWYPASRLVTLRTPAASSPLTMRPASGERKAIDSPRICASSQTPPSAMVTAGRPSAVAIRWASDVLPQPGGPAKQITGAAAATRSLRTTPRPAGPGPRPAARRRRPSRPCGCRRARRTVRAAVRPLAPPPCRRPSAPRRRRRPAIVGNVRWHRAAPRCPARKLPTRPWTGVPAMKAVTAERDALLRTVAELRDRIKTLVGRRFQGRRPARLRPSRLAIAEPPGLPLALSAPILSRHIARADTPPVWFRTVNRGCAA